MHHICDALHMVWWMELENQVEYGTFKFHTHLYMLHKKNSTMSVMFMVTKDNGQLQCNLQSTNVQVQLKGWYKNIPNTSHPWINEHNGDHISIVLGGLWCTSHFS